MPKTFDPLELRQSYESFVLGFERVQQRSMCPEHTLGSHAMASLSAVVYAWLVGLNAEIRPSLVRSYEWLSESIDLEETLGESPAFHRAKVYEARGLACWMLHSTNDPQSYLGALRCYDVHFQEEGFKNNPKAHTFNYETQRFEDLYIRGLPMTNKDILGGSLVSYMAACAQCGEYERGIRLYERVGGRTDIGPNKIQHPVHYGYWLCKELLQDQQLSARHCEVGRRVLRTYLQGQWLNYGQATTAAHWLKIVYWHTGQEADPEAILLRSYDDMPKVDRPSFV